MHDVSAAAASSHQTPGHVPLEARQLLPHVAEGVQRLEALLLLQEVQLQVLQSLNTAAAHASQVGSNGVDLLST